MKQIILFIFLSNCISAYSQATDTILWRESYRLNWGDFKRQPDEGSGQGAISDLILTYVAKSNGREMECNVFCYFNRQESWVKSNSKLDYILRHEQAHFDLQEVYARKLRKSFHEHTFKRKNFNSDMKKIFGKISKAVLAKQKKYDKATGHALNEAKQKKWSKKIADDLKKFEQYKNSSVTLKVK